MPEDNTGASAKADQALAVPVEHVARLDPTGFDPSRDEFWTEAYIDNAATARVSIYRADGSLFTDRASNYDTPNNGIHLCGITDDEEQPTTVAAYVMPPASAFHAFALAKEVAECGKEEADFVVDLCIDGSIEEDFWSNRQLWSLAIRAWNDAIAMEARQRTDREAGLDPKGDSAGSQDIAQTPSEGL